MGVFSDHPVECKRLDEHVRLRHSATATHDSTAVSTAAKVLAGPASYPVAARKPADHGVHVVAVQGPQHKKIEKSPEAPELPAAAAGAPEKPVAPSTGAAQQGVSLAAVAAAAVAVMAGSFAAGVYYAHRLRARK
jgi:hypothetical protein